MMVSHIGDRRQRRRSKERNGMATKQAYNLYWVTTEDHGEDWFVFARTPRSAAKSHEDYIGYEPGDASALQVLKDVHLPRFESERPPYCASIDDLKQLGIEVVEPEPHQRHVSLGGDPLAVGCFNPLVLLCAEEVAEAFANGRRSGSRPARAS
jgi:hypothetical protein